MATRSDLLFTGSPLVGQAIATLNLAGISSNQGLAITTVPALSIGQAATFVMSPVYDDVYVLFQKINAGDGLVLQTLSNQQLSVVNLPGVTPAANTFLYRLERNIPITVTMTASAAFTAGAAFLNIQGVQAGTLTNYIYLPPMGSRPLKPGSGSLTVDTYQASTSVVQNGLRYSFNSFYIPMDDNNMASDYVVDILTTKLPIQFNWTSRLPNDYREAISSLNPGNTVAVTIPSIFRGQYITGVITYEAPSIGSPTTPPTYSYDMTFTVENQWDENFSLRGGQAGYMSAPPAPDRGIDVNKKLMDMQGVLTEIWRLLKQDENLARQDRMMDQKVDIIHSKLEDAIRKL